MKGDLNPGEAYTVTINGDLALSFTVPGETSNAMVKRESPIESVAVAETDGGYNLTVVSRLPKGSSCSSFNGYHINRRFFGRVEVTVTHFEVLEDNVPCTRDLPVAVTEIQLGDNFESGRAYTLSVNGEETAFLARWTRLRLRNRKPAGNHLGRFSVVGESTIYLSPPDRPGESPQNRSISQ